ncbi:DUF2690 domain-containing protein [Streptomyces sp. NPDC047072]|uniref:DUF2690 domain-containing protein n=1 Tax=Streptomyces sp. NPDC047072 TaxID=3154809 RepID=UPI0033C02335
MKARYAMLVASAVTASLIGFASPAQALPYDGADPVASGCANTAVTARHTWMALNGYVAGRIDLRYSTACRTVWARVVNFKRDGGGAKVARQTGPDAAASCTVSQYSSSLGGYYCYTEMLDDAGYVSTAAGWVVDPSGSKWYASTTAY